MLKYFANIKNMNIIYIKWAVILIFVSQYVTGKAQQPETLFDQANQLYAQEEYAQAIALYDSVMGSGNISHELFFNLGNAWFKLNDLPKAIVNYERAKLLAPNDEDINFNLELTNTYLTDKITAVPEFRIKKWLNAMSLWMRPNTWALLGVLAFAFTLFLFLLYRKTYKSGLRKWAFTGSLIWLMLAAVFIYMGNRQKNYVLDNPYAIVNEPTVMVKSTPDMQSTDLFVIHEGLKVEVLEDYFDWSEIKLANGNKGWMQTNELIMISAFN